MQTRPHELADDEPPLLIDESDDNQRDEQCADDSDATIMDEMIAIAQRAKESKRAQQDRERKSKSFGAGLKKGFFDTPAKKNNASMAITGTRKNQRLEPSAVAAKREDRLRVVDNAGKSTRDDLDAKTTPFVFSEVQDSLQGMKQLNPKQWMNDKFFAKMSKHPKLLIALQNPRFSQAISELQHDPKAAMLKYQKDADVSLMLRDFLGFLGDHFEELGKEQGDNQQQPKKPMPAAPPFPAIVDLDEARRDAIAKMQRSPDEEQQVQQILQNPELLAALSDGAFMEQLRLSQQDPQVFRRLTQDPRYAAKLRLLTDAKMVSFS